ncbi:MAG: response regulator, partial [Chloroflexota bacterium]
MNTKKPLRGLIMVVDDVVENVEVLLRILDFAGYEIAVANNGPSALEQIAVRKPDLVLLDVMMPGGMDGFEVCERLK